MFFISQITNDEEKNREERKLRDCINYAESQTCRTRTILRYFGEEGSGNCGHCDNCLEAKEMIDATEITQKILSGVIRTGNRFGIAHVIQVLRGSENQTVLKNGHDSLSVYGIIKEYSRDELKHLIRSLIDHGLLRLSDGEYPILQVTDEGVLFLREKQSINLPKPKAEEISARKKTSQELTPSEPVFEALRKLRKHIADEAHVPPFVIFSDVALIEMAHFLPQTDDDFLEITGVGRQKLASFGTSFQDLIRQLTQEYDLAPRTRQQESRQEKSSRPSKQLG